MADIGRAFLMISVEERDRDFLCFLWVDNIDKGVTLNHTPSCSWRDGVCCRGRGGRIFTLLGNRDREIT